VGYVLYSTFDMKYIFEKNCKKVFTVRLRLGIYVYEPSQQYNEYEFYSGLCIAHTILSTSSQKPAKKCSEWDYV
jgi:hypothetical protein